MEGSGITAITGGMTNAVTLVESALSAILANTTLMIILGGGFLTFALRKLSAFFRTSKRV